MPGLGYVSVVEVPTLLEVPSSESLREGVLPPATLDLDAAPSGRSKDLQLQEYGLVGPMLATFIASLAVRAPDVPTLLIQEFLLSWVGVSLSIGTLDRCIREAGIACAAVVEQLLEELQSAEVIHLDETPWYEKGKFCWLWVAFSQHDCGVPHWQSQKGRTAAPDY